MSLSTTFKVIRKFYKTIFFLLQLIHTLVSPKKYFAKNLELCGPRNWLFSTAASVTKLKPLLTKREYFFFKTFSQKSFPFYKENCMDIMTTFGVRNGNEVIGCLRGLLKKTITLGRGLQILSPFRIFLYYSITLSKIGEHSL